MKPVALTTDIFLHCKMHSSFAGMSMQEEMIGCIQDHWTLEEYVDYLAQFFLAESIREVIEPYWNQYVTQE